MLDNIKVREHRRGNQTLRIQRNWQYIGYTRQRKQNNWR